jgi:hypothetical protein
MPSAASPLFDATEPTEVLAELHRDQGELLEALERSLEEGLRGSTSGAVQYACIAHELTTRLLREAWSRVAHPEDGLLFQAVPKAAPGTEEPSWTLLVELVQGEAATAPFTAWPVPPRATATQPRCT